MADNLGLRKALEGDALALEFIDHPERFDPTDHTLMQIYDKAYWPSGDWLAIPQEARIAMARARVACGDMRNVKVEIKMGYSSTAGAECPIIAKTATCVVKNDDGREVAKNVEDEGTAFVTSAFIQRKDAT